MSEQDISNNISKHSRHAIHPFHAEKIVRHAVRNIKGAKELCDQVYNKTKTTRTRLPEFQDHVHEGLKHFWS